MPNAFRPWLQPREHCIRQRRELLYKLEKTDYE